MRVKGGPVSRRRHKRLLKLTEGFRGRRRNCYKLAKRSVQKALQHAYKARKKKKNDFRTLWIARINAGARVSGISYSSLIKGLKQANVELDRKSLADLASRDADAFSAIVEKAREGLRA